MKRIDKYAFNQCTSLKQITIPASTSINGGYVFCNCSSLEQVTYEALSSDYGIGFGQLADCISLTIHIDFLVDCLNSSAN